MAQQSSYYYNSQSKNQENEDERQNNFEEQQNIIQEDQRDILEYLRSMGIFQKISSLIEPPTQQTEELKKKLHVLQMRIEQNFPFTDTIFPPSESSISDTKLFPKVEWKRLKQLVRQDSLRFLVQGKPIDFLKISSLIDDRYIISALNILLGKMDMIVRNFEITEINNAGIFGFWVNQGGQWDLMVLDDNFPTLNSEYCMAQTNNGIWMMVLEKALAKMYRSYDAMNGGFTQNALTDLTGAPTEVIEEGSAEDWYQQIDSWIKRGFLVFAENERNINSPNILQNCGYSFSVLAIENLGNNQIIVKLKSPLNSIIFEGDWRNSSSKWTNSLRNTYEVKPCPSEDGTFWMSLQEFKNSFTFLGNLRTHENYVYKWIDIDHTGRNQSIVKFTMEHKSHMYIILNQQDERIAINNSPNFEYPCTRIIVAKVNNDKQIKTYSLIGSNYLSQREIFIEDIFTPGEYIITIEIYWVQNNDRIFTISFYGEQVPTNIQETDTSSLLSLQKQIIQQMALNNPMPTQKIRDYANNGEPYIKVFNDIIAGMVYFVYQNKGTKKLRERVEMVELENLIICKPFENSNVYDVSVSPQNEQIVIYKYNPFGEKFSFNCKIRAGLDQVIQPAPELTQNQVVDEKFEVENQISGAQAVFQQQGIFNSQEMRNSKLLKLNNMRNSKVQMLMSRNDYVEDNGGIQYSQTDLIKIMKSNSVPSKRMWKDQEIGVFIHHYQHSEGAVILIQNLGQFQYEEQITLSLENLIIENTKDEIIPRRFEINFANSIITAYVDPGNHQFIFLGVLKKGEPYAFKLQSLYKYHSN